MREPFFMVVMTISTLSALTLVVDGALFALVNKDLTEILVMKMSNIRRIGINRTMLRAQQGELSMLVEVETANITMIESGKITEVSHE